MFFGVYVCTYVYPHAFMTSGLYLILYFCVCMYVYSMLIFLKHPSTNSECSRYPTRATQT